MNKMRQIVDNELTKHNVVVRKWTNGNSGRTYNNTKEIKVPYPVDFITLGICFHEIGHVVCGHMEMRNKKYRYIEEYEAEQYAIQKLKEYGFYNKQYEFSAISYVLTKLAQAKNRGHNMREVPKEIVKWSGLQVNRWNKAKKIFVYHRYYKKKSDIVIQFR